MTIGKKRASKMAYGVDRMGHGVKAKQGEVRRRRGDWSVQRKKGDATACRSARTDSGGATDGGSGSERRASDPLLEGWQPNPQGTVRRRASKLRGTNCRDTVATIVGGVGKGVCGEESAAGGALCGGISRGEVCRGLVPTLR